MRMGARVRGWKHLRHITLCFKGETPFDFSKRAALVYISVTEQLSSKYNCGGDGNIEVKSWVSINLSFRRI